MAVYQKKYLLVPIKLDKNKLNYSVLEESNVWSELYKKDEITKLIDNLFIRNKWKGDNFIVWGQTQTDDITLFFDENNIKLIQVRLDIRKKTDFLDKLIELCSIIGANLIDENNELINPEISSISKSTKNSKAFNFISDPIAYLEKLKSKKS